MAIVLDGTLGTTTPALTDSALTSGRVTYAGTSGVLQDSAALTFDGIDLAIGNAGGLALFKRASDGLSVGRVGSRSSTDISVYNAGGVTSEFVAGANELRFNVAAAEQMRLNSTGLGIGTSSPAYKLHVQNNAANTDTFVGQASTVGLFTQWRYNATTASAYGEISTYGGANNLYIQNQGSNGSVFICVNGGNVGIGTASPNASAILDAQSTTKGVRMPNMTTTQKNAIASPAAGLMVFDTTLAKLCVYSGSAWQTITSV